MSYPTPVTKLFGETVALTSTVAYTAIPPQTHQMLLYNPSVDFRLHLNVPLIDINFYDASGVSGSRYVKDNGTLSLKQALTDKNSGTGSETVLDSLVVDDDFLYLCTPDIVGGFHINVKSANGTTNTIVAEYWKNRGIKKLQ